MSRQGSKSIQASSTIRRKNVEYLGNKLIAQW